MRREVLSLGAAVAISPAAVMARPAVLEVPSDSVAGYVKVWLIAAEARETAPDPEGNGRSPECEYWDDERFRLEALIRKTPMRTMEDLAGLMMFLRIDNCTEGDPWPAVQGWALEKLERWAASCDH